MKADEIIAREIPGFEDRYSITRYGRVWSHARPGTKGGWLKSYIEYDPRRSSVHGHYLRIHLGRNHFLIHWLVMITWGPPRPSPAHQINHRDLNKLNNHTSNLEWTTAKENTQHAIANDRHVNPPAKKDSNHRASLRIVALRREAKRRGDI